MSYTPCDYMDDLNGALGISLDTETCGRLPAPAIEEVERLQAIETTISRLGANRCCPHHDERSDKEQ